ncbi:MAG: MgtC/SapB family protein [Chloroflexi bacterium]|nr:MgtC/SapB family protein [Chloroflexota bacterium]
MEIHLIDAFKICLAILVGGLIGAEREFRDKAAGFRTIIFICVGSALFTIFSSKIGGAGDPVRIAANIVSGVGFLGAGAIMRGEGQVIGLTTAATVWLAAALGMGIGGGYYLIAIAAAVAILVVLWLFPIVEGWIDNARETRTYQIITPIGFGKFAQLEGTFVQCSLRAKGHRHKRGDDMVSTWIVSGSPKNHVRLTERLFDDPDVKEFIF